MDDLQQQRDMIGSRSEDSRHHGIRLSVPLVLSLLILGFIAGCRSNEDLRFDPDYASFQAYVQEIEYPEVCEPMCTSEELFAGSRPASVRNFEEQESWPLTLEEVVEIALQNSEVIRNIGGVMQTGSPVNGTVYDPAIQETSPVNGVERALSAFDAQFAAAMYLNQNERKFNNAIGQLLQGGRSNTNDFQAEIWKVAPTGSRFAIRNLTNYVRNNAALADPNDPDSFGQRYRSVSETLFQAEARHPLLRGSGVEVNRIAGPNAVPGFYDGVLLSRLNTDVSLTQFESNVRDLLRDVETAYWELLFAYYNLDSKKDARGFALKVWENQKERVKTGKGRPDDEALARQQYYAAQSLVENALGGTSAGTIGLYTRERELRRLMGLSPTDGRLIRPVSQPAPAPVEFDWDESLQNALVRRVELRERKWEVRRRELQLIAARNMLLPQLDLVAQYGFRGFGDDLFGQSNSAFDDLFGGDLQQWQVGMEFAVPIGNRIGHVAARHAELQLARERALLREQERYIAHDLAEAFTNMDRAFVLTKSTYNSRVAAMEERDAKQLRYLVTEGPFFLLDAQQRLTTSEIAFYRSVIDYSIALMELQYTRGTLLDQMQVYLAEGPWSDLAHYNAARQSRRFQDGGAIGHVMQDTAPVSAGAYDQQPGLENVPQVETP